MNEGVVYHYWLNWMGPIDREWIQTNGDHWCGGRIDVSPGNNEIGVPIMHSDDWQKFCIWLSHYTTQELSTFNDVLKAYYRDGNAEICWWEKPK